MADASTVTTALAGLVDSIAGSKLSAADKAKVALYAGIVGSLLNEALPAIDGKVNWAGIEAGIAQTIAGIETTYGAISPSQETSTNG